MQKLSVCLLVCLTALRVSAQSPLENKVYKNSLRTVLCYNSKSEQSFPIIQLGSAEQITFSFDELGPSNAAYTYTIEHCTPDWKLSPITRLDYLDGFPSDRIMDYRLSFNTIQQYTHYELKLPNEQMRPKIAGNYILKVFEEGKMSAPVITQRFFITNDQVNVGIEMQASNIVPKRASNQKINFTIFHQFPIPNPRIDVKAVVMQNYDQQGAQFQNSPSFVRPASLVYSDMNSNDFEGGNEFRKFDIRNLRFKGSAVQDIFRDTVNSVILYKDDALGILRYSNQFDENGNYFIINQNGRDNRTDADYARVFFTLTANMPSANGTAYVVGRFNNYALTDENKLTYNAQRKTFTGNYMVKQGLYDYKYIWVPSGGKPSSAPFEGSFFETENSYQVLIYLKKPGARWEELAGFSTINTVKRR